MLPAHCSKYDSDVCGIAELKKSVDVLCSAVDDSTLSVRVSAASALANLAEALQQQQQQLSMQLMPSLSKLAAGMLCTTQQHPVIIIDMASSKFCRWHPHMFTKECLLSWVPTGYL